MDSSDIELMRMRMAHESAKKYTYHHLKTDGAVWDSKAFNYIETDQLIMTEHVGNFQPLYYYHTVKDTFMNPDDRDKRVNEFKKMIGGKTGEFYTRDFCRQIDSYYRNL